MKNIKVLGIDLAKNIFQLHGVDHKGECILRKRLSREKLIEFMSNFNPCTVAIEACGSAHYWARVFTKMEHTVKMMSPQFVKPYIKSNKNDRNDAEGITEASMRPNMKFVPIKQIEQQDVLLLHRARELVIKQRTAQEHCFIKAITCYFRKGKMIDDMFGYRKKKQGYNKAAVALANKNARIIWAMLSTGECYRGAKACA